MESTAERVRTLDRQTCLELLGRGGLGRIGITDRALPAVVPVRFTFLDTHIVLTAAAGSLLERATNGSVVAFQIDGLDPNGAGMWSVSIVGWASHPGRVELAHLGPITLPKWSTSLPDRLVCIRPEVVTGQRWEGSSADAGLPS